MKTKKKQTKPTKGKRGRESELVSPVKASKGSGSFTPVPTKPPENVKARTIPENPVKIQKGSTALEVLKIVFGYDGFRVGQEEVINSILSGKDTLAIMPTSAGKSLTFQIPALMADGITVVVSPLIALMQDQVEALARKNVRAAIFNSMLSSEEYAAEVRAVESGEAKMIYVAPERLQNDNFMSFLKRLNVKYLCIDEAHACSEYGHDFRPDYAKLGMARKRLQMPQVIAVTATATPKVKKDISNILKMESFNEFCFGFERPNLVYNINEIFSKGVLSVPETKIERIKDIVDKFKTGIIYCSTKKAVDLVHIELRSKYKIEKYHAGMADEERNKVLEKFVSKQADVVVATNAFGMGIDRSDVRFVVHYSIPGSIEAYSQEAGRAGRDGKDSYCEILYSSGDIWTQKFFVDGKNPSKKMIEGVFNFIREEVDSDNEIKMSQTDFIESYKTGDDNPMAIEAAVNTLVKYAALEKFDLDARKKGIRLITDAKNIKDLKIDWGMLEEKASNDNQRLDEMIKLAKSHNCTQSNILKYFEVPAKPCGKCSKCLGLKAKDFTK